MKFTVSTVSALIALVCTTDAMSVKEAKCAKEGEVSNGLACCAGLNPKLNRDDITYYCKKDAGDCKDGPVFWCESQKNADLCNKTREICESYHPLTGPGWETKAK
eukprot:Pgem_evm1s5368